MLNGNSSNSSILQPTVVVNGGQKNANNHSSEQPPLLQKDLLKYAENIKEFERFGGTLGGRVDLTYFSLSHERYRNMVEDQEKGRNTLPNSFRNEYIILFSCSFDIMDSLIELQNAAEAIKNKDRQFYRAACELWKICIVLAQKVLNNSTTPVGFNERQRKLNVLTKSLKQVVVVLENPTSNEARKDLEKASQEMYAEIGGPFLFRRENRYWAGAVGALGFILGLTIYLAAIVSSPITIIGGVLGISLGITLMAYCRRMVYDALWPDDCEVNVNIYKEKEQARDAATAFKVFANTKFFAPISPLENGNHKEDSQLDTEIKVYPRGVASI